MTDLMRYAAALEDMGPGNIPPVDSWDPAYCGDLDMVIKRDGTWVHEGTPIARARLARLFSLLLKKEGADYFLVTPVEKLRIKVEDVPFVAALALVENRGPEQRISLRTNFGETLVIGPAHPVSYRKGPPPEPTSGRRRRACADELTPYVTVRRDLEARIAPQAFFDIAAWGGVEVVDGREMFGVRSDGAFFPLQEARSVFG